MGCELPLPAPCHDGRLPIYHCQFFAVMSVCRAHPVGSVPRWPPDELIVDFVPRWPPAELTRLRAVCRGSSNLPPSLTCYSRPCRFPVVGEAITVREATISCSAAAPRSAPKMLLLLLLLRAIRLDRPRSIRVAKEERRMRDRARLLLLLATRWLHADLTDVLSVCPPSSFPSNHPEGLYILRALCPHLPTFHLILIVRRIHGDAQRRPCDAETATLPIIRRRRPQRLRRRRHRWNDAGRSRRRRRWGK